MPRRTGLLAAEVVINHPLVGLCGGCNFINARAAQTLGGELRGRRFKDAGHGARRVVGARRCKSVGRSALTMRVAPKRCQPLNALYLIATGARPTCVNDQFS